MNSWGAEQKSITETFCGIFLWSCFSFVSPIHSQLFKRAIILSWSPKANNYRPLQRSDAQTEMLSLNHFSTLHVQIFLGTGNIFCLGSSDRWGKLCGVELGVELGAAQMATWVGARWVWLKCHLGFDITDTHDIVPTCLGL